MTGALVGRWPRLHALVLSLLLVATSAGVVAPVAAQEPEPVPVVDAFIESGDAAGEDDRFAWTLTDGPAAWAITIDGPEGERVEVDLLDADGTLIDRTGSESSATLPDLALERGSYTIRVRRSTRESLPYQLRAERQAMAYDAEPNDARGTPVPIADGTTVEGRLARPDGDRDRYVIEVAADALIRDVVLESAGTLDRGLCLLAADGSERMCRTDAPVVALPGLVLAPGRHLLEVRGSIDPETPYELRVDVIGEAGPDVEAEPNDDPATASPLDASIGLRGRSDAADRDHFRVDIEGEPQLWRWTAEGPDILRFDYLRRDGTDLETAEPLRGGDGDGVAVLEDLYLVTGTHHFRIRTGGGPYEISAVPLGPPDPDQEREPNSDTVRAEPYLVGSRRTGRLPTTKDVDHLRFTAAAREHLRMALEQPADGDFQLRLTTGSRELLRRKADAPGERLEVELLLEPGDYLVTLVPDVPSEGRYALESERLDPFDPATDSEPNDDHGFARPVPPSLAWEGTSGAGGDTDWFRLPELPAPADVRVSLDDERALVRVFAGPRADERLDLERDDDGTFVIPDAPGGVPLFLELRVATDYSVSVAADGWQAAATPPEPAVEATLELEAEVVAAYWPEAQRVAGTLTITNSGERPATLALTAATSHHAWRAMPALGEVAIAAGGTEAVPVELHIDPDVWAGVPVRIDIDVRDADGGRLGATARIVAAPDAPAVGSRPGWPLPDALVGGLNVAAIGLGAEPAGTVRADREPLLYDGVTPAGGGFGSSIGELPVELVVDLAGDAPVPIVGTIVNPLARSSAIGEVPRSIELLLSTDGSTWTTVLTGEVSPLAVDQAFVLEAPVEATHAMLRIHSLHAGGDAFLSMGEWKVVAAPGVEPDTMPRNIADPVRGGHVVRRRPFAGGMGFIADMLDGDPRREQVSTPAEDPRFEVVIGFQDERAAAISGLRWRDPDDSDVRTRLAEVVVETSEVGPFGPWSSFGTWRLDRDASGEVAPLDFITPVWARYVRLTGERNADERQIEQPSAIEVLERPADDAYRSVLAEWGYTSSRGPLEWSRRAPADEVTTEGQDASDTRAGATPLPFDAPVADRAEIEVDEDWYAITLPADANTLTLEVTGLPTVGVRLTLHERDGGVVPMDRASAPGGAVRYEAEVEPGGSYDLLVEQPPFDIVFTFDTSGSMGPFLDFVYEGVREFAADVRPGRESVTILPFGSTDPIALWDDRPYALIGAVNGFTGDEVSSEAESALIDSAELLSARDGLRAILVVTDAETASIGSTPELWDAFDAVRPIVYSVHVGASSNPVPTRHLMQSWASAAGGEYAYPTSHAEMDRAFERMSTRLRRPAAYTLTATATAVNREPGAIAVGPPPGSEEPVLAAGVAVELIVDTSGSMRKRLAGEPRIAIAKRSLRRLVADGLADGVPFALRTFGGPGRGRAARCATTLALPFGPLDRAATVKRIGRLRAPKRVKTPIADAIAAAGADLADATGTRIVVLVTDGDETCGGDPTAAIERLRDAGVEATLNIVGFALEDEALKERMAAWAAAGAGTYFDAAGADDLVASLGEALSAPVRIYAQDGTLVASGIVGSEPVSVPVGTYRVEVLTDPVTEFTDVEVQGGQLVGLSLPEVPDPAP